MCDERFIEVGFVAGDAADATAVAALADGDSVGHADISNSTTDDTDSAGAADVSVREQWVEAVKWWCIVVCLCVVAAAVGLTIGYALSRSPVWLDKPLSFILLSGLLA